MKVYPAHIKKLARSYLDNPEFIQKAIDLYPSALIYAADHFRDDPNYQRLMFSRQLELQSEYASKVQIKGQIYDCVEPRMTLGSDLGKPLLIQAKEIALLAVQCEGEDVFEHLSDELRIDPEVALAHWIHHPNAEPRSLDPEILASDEFGFRASELAPQLPALREEFNRDREYVLRAIEYCTHKFPVTDYAKHIDKSLLEIPEIAFALIRQNPANANISTAQRFVHKGNSPSLPSK